MIERELAKLIMGQSEASPLMSDAYKFSMAQAGAPLRPEGFYGGFRKPGLYFNPFHLDAVLQAFKPRQPNAKENGFLQANGYGFTPAMEMALDQAVKVLAVPKGTWFNGGEPHLLVKSSEFLASWYEPLAIILRFPIQVATAALMENRTKFTASCETEKKIIELTFEAIGRKGAAKVTVDEEGYRKQVRRRVQSIIDALSGEADRAFEVGFRAVTCMEQHRIALDECQKLGLLKTSNAFIAYEKYLIPVGTTGHEHQLRHGADANGYRACRDMRPEPPSYLPDTYNTMELGIPAAIEVMQESGRRCTVRFDNRDEQDEQFEKFIQYELTYQDAPFYVFEDSYDDERTVQNEKFAASKGIPRYRRLYGYGSFIVVFETEDDEDEGNKTLTRNGVSCIYKLCQTGNRAVMKISKTGKTSLPGLPIVFRRVKDTPTDLEYRECTSLVGQVGEIPPNGFCTMADMDRYDTVQTEEAVIGHSPDTKALVKKNMDELEARLAEARA